MIEESGVKQFNQSSQRASYNWKSMPVELLLQYRAEIDAALPATKLSDLNLEEELVIQYLETKALQASVIGDDETPANQKAQVANACSSILQQIVKCQAELHNAERFKTIEMILIKHMKRLPRDVVAAFLEDYERAVR